MNKFLFVFTILCLLNFAFAHKVKFSVYYEALCPDSKSFLTQQLFPLWQDADIKKCLNLTLIPFGKASYKETNDAIEFTCEHGPDECKANTYQACAIKKFGVDVGLNYANCLMKEKEPVKFLESCAKEANLDFKDLTACKESKSLGQTYLKEYGDITLAQNPKLKSIPSIIFNDKYDDKIQSDSLKNLKAVVCSQFKDKKPKSC